MASELVQLTEKLRDLCGIPSKRGGLLHEAFDPLSMEQEDLGRWWMSLIRKLVRQGILELGKEKVRGASTNWPDSKLGDATIDLFLTAMPKGGYKLLATLVEPSAENVHDDLQNFETAMLSMTKSDQADAKNARFSSTASADKFQAEWVPK